jgi:hypothetical protein
MGSCLRGLSAVETEKTKKNELFKMNNQFCGEPTTSTTKNLGGGLREDTGSPHTFSPEAEKVVRNYRDNVRELIRLLEIEEESDSGSVFRPNHISSCRVMDGMQMNQCLKALKELAQK